ncbi:MAG: aminomethyltransferase family protein, partial [Planctomycetota bacterium]
CGADLSGVRYYGFATAPVADVDCLLARTGYTGEDGFELFLPKAHARRVWDLILGSGHNLQVAPIGLGARDILRLEAGMPLYGQEISTEINPLEADLAFGLDLSKSDTVGIPALQRIQEEGPAREAVSLCAAGGRVARPGCRLFVGDEDVGFVTSGGRSPTLDKTIARALVRAGAVEVGGRLDADIRGKRYPFDVVPAPFYRRKR